MTFEFYELLNAVVAQLLPLLIGMLDLSRERMSPIVEFIVVQVVVQELFVL